MPPPWEALSREGSVILLRYQTINQQLSFNSQEHSCNQCDLLSFSTSHSYFIGFLYSSTDNSPLILRRTKQDLNLLHFISSILLSALQSHSAFSHFPYQTRPKIHIESKHPWMILCLQASLRDPVIWALVNLCQRSRLAFTTGWILIMTDWIPMKTIRTAFWHQEVRVF